MVFLSANKLRAIVWSLEVLVGLEPQSDLLRKGSFKISKDFKDDLY